MSKTTKLDKLNGFVQLISPGITNCFEKDVIYTLEGL